MENLIQENELSSIFIVDNSNISIYNSKFRNLTMSSILFNVSSNNFIENDFKMSFCLLEQIYFTKSILGIILISHYNNVDIEGSYFLNLMTNSNIIDFDSINSNLILQNLIFNQSNANYQILNIKNVFNLTIMHTKFNENNRLDNFGGNIRIYNSFYKTFRNVIISFCYSTKTSYGIKFIDDSVRKAPNDNNISFILIDSCIFIHNLIYYYRSEEGAGAIYLNSPDKFILHNSSFQVFFLIFFIKSYKKQE